MPDFSHDADDHLIPSVVMDDTPYICYKMGPFRYRLMLGDEWIRTGDGVPYEWPFYFQVEKFIKQRKQTKE